MDLEDFERRLFGNETIESSPIGMRERESKDSRNMGIEKVKIYIDKCEN